MKKIILPIFFLFLSSVSQADSLEMSTILKPPINTFNRLQLIPKAINPATCTDGTVYLSLTRDVMICNNNALSTIHSPWSQRGNLIYLRDWTRQVVKVGVGTRIPSKKFEVSNDTLIPGIPNSFQIDTRDANQNLGINIITRGVPTPGTPEINSMAFLSFRITAATSGRIVYYDRRNAAGVPWGRSGLGITSSPGNIYDIWMDANNGNVGIGLGVVPATRVQDFAQSPAQQLEVKNGSLKTNRAFLTAPDGSNTAQLKTSYAAGGYYAVLAP